MRGACKIINTHNFTHNLQTLSALAPASQCVAVLKANAYGCEAKQLIKAAEKADLLAVATIEEAIELRHEGTEKPILLLEGVFNLESLELAYQERFEPVVAIDQQLETLLSFSGVFNRIWCKLDTGMGRLGFQGNESYVAIDKLLTRYSQENIVLMTHFSDSDAPERSKTLSQIEQFDKIAACFPQCKQSLCNSAGILAYPDAHRDYIRPGIALYGASPFAGNYAEDHELNPVMTLSTRVISVKHFKLGETIGYGETYTMQTNGYIAVCGIGYADGYSRFIPSGTPILINDKEYKLVGRVSMDMITVLVDETVLVGDMVTCWGENIPIERICDAADTIPHQLLTTVTERPKKKII